MPELIRRQDVGTGAARSYNIDLCSPRLLPPMDAKCLN